MKNHLLSIALSGFILLGCGEESDSSNNVLLSNETISQVQNINVNSNLIGENEALGKVIIPPKSNDVVEEITLVGEGAELFTVSNDGTLKSTSSLNKIISKASNASQKMIRSEKTFTITVQIRYLSGEIESLTIKITVYIYSSDNTLTSSEISVEPSASTENGIEEVMSAELEESELTPPTLDVPLSISGIAKVSTNVNNAYQFLPLVSDNNNELTFTIENKPSWAEFNTQTGLLEGRPSLSDEGIHNNIIISVSDGTETVSLNSFSIEVNPALDIAHTFGKATQGTTISYRYFSSPLKAIDNNDTTSNCTSGGADGKNWLQVELPNLTKVNKIVLKNRSHAYRMTNAKVYISDTPYIGDLENSTLIKTLQATTKEQVIELETPITGRYLLVKGEVRSQNDRQVHLKKLEVYGEVPVTPVFNEHQTSYLLPIDTAIGSVVATIDGVDYQDDFLTYSIDSETFSIDNSGNIKIKDTLLAGDYPITVTLTDGINTTTQSIVISVTSANAVEEALNFGSVKKVTEKELLEATLNEIEALTMLDAKVKIFNLNSDGTVKNDGTSLTNISWEPTHDASVFTPMVGENTPLLTSNAVTNNNYKVYNEAIAIIGDNGSSNYALFGANPFRNTINNDMQQVLKNTLSWLTQRDDLNDNTFKVVMTHMDESSWFKDESATRAWFDKNYAEQVSYNEADSCDGLKLKGCLEDAPDLLIISQIATSSDNIEAITQTLNEAMENGVPVLYIHNNGNQTALGEALFSSVFDVSYKGDNYWRRLTVQNFNPLEMKIMERPNQLNSIHTMLEHFQTKDYNFDWTMCQDDDKYTTYGENCTEVVGLNESFQGGASAAESMVRTLDGDKTKIFETQKYRLAKLLVLLGDKFRENVHYPMDKVVTNNTEFMKSFYSDHVVFNYRKINPVQPDMGNFSRSDFSHITPITKTVELISKKSFRSTGAYALPGQTVRVTRNDDSNVSVDVFINTLRAAATHQYQKNGYKRPKYLQSPYYAIKSGETIEFTSPYGGPLQLKFSTNDLPVNVTFENVGEHAYWASEADNLSFAQKLEANEYDWAEVATAGFEVHSKLDKMLKSISNVKWGTAEALAAGIVKYTSNYPHVLAGFKGKGVDVVPEIHDWAEEKGLTISTIDKMKHMNADQASCGYGCSGNPYDAYWAFDPVGHGDIHELGHSLQKKRFEGFPNHAATNTFSYYTKSRLFENTGIVSTCQGLKFKTVFDTVQSAVGEDNVTAYLKTNLWDKEKLGAQYLLKIEAMMHAQKLGKLKNGWHLLARVHILEREMYRAKKDWENRKASVGFSTYSLDEIKSIRNNDWLIVAYSYASELDYRNYFDMMGIPFSQKARDQIASFGFEEVPKSLFVSTNTGYCAKDEYGTLFDKETLSIDGTTTYSY